MSVLFIEGYDKYGPANANTASVNALLTAGEWTTATTTLTVVAPLSVSGQALLLGSGSTLSKTLAANYSRLIGGVRFSSTLAAIAGIQFMDVGTAQAGISINTAGTFSVKTGGALAGTVLGTSTATVSANTTHYLEWDITFNNSGSFQLWLDGVSILGPTTGDTTGTANSYANAVQFITQASGALTIDDLYLFDTAGASNNSVLLTSPRIETQFPNADSAVQFAIGAAILGSSIARTAGSSGLGANQMYLRPFTPTRNCTLNSIGFLGGSTSFGSAQLRGIIYADSSGVPGALMTSGATIVGSTANATTTLPLASPQSLSAGTQYWLGYMHDIAMSPGFATQDTANAGRSVAATFASGAPGTAPAMTPGVFTATLWGNISGTGANYYCSQQPTVGNNSYVFDATVGHEDLYAYPPLSTSPSAIYAVAVKASVSKSDAGAKTVSMRMKSGATDSAGSAGALAPGTAYAWLTSLFPTDPATSAAWTLTALNAATSGVKVES